LFATQIWLCPVQSVFVVHSFGVVVDDPGAPHRPWLHTVPLSHSVSTVHVFWQPALVHTLPVAHEAFPVHGGGALGVTLLQP
jgi:hypothetical protein